MTDQPTDACRAEAERAWQQFIASLTEPIEPDDHKWPFVTGYLAGDAAGYARCLAEIERLRIHWRQQSGRSYRPGQQPDTYSEMVGQIDTMLYLMREGWHCPDPTHTRCQAKQEGAQE